MIDKVVLQSGGADKKANELKNTIVFAENKIVPRGHTYYISNDGNDLNDGLSIDSPKATLASISNIRLLPDDTVLFERNSIFRLDEMFWLSPGVNYGAYGEGEKPKFYGSLKNYAQEELWNKSANQNIWFTSINVKERASLAIFNDDEFIGNWKFTFEELKQDGDFYHDTEKGIFYLYFESGNPGALFSDIEIATTEVAMRASFLKWIHINNICFKYFTRGAFLLGEVDDITISDCEIGFVGGRIFNMRKEGPLRFGNAVEFWYQCRNLKVNNCYIYQVFDAALTFQGLGAGQAYFDNIEFSNNLIEYCSMNIEFWAGGKDDPKPPHISNIFYTENIIRFAGYGWGGIYRWDKEDQASLLGWNGLYSDLSDFYIENNTIDCSDCYMIYTKTPDEQKGLTVRNNSYYQKPYTGRNVFVDIIKDKAKANNQEEFEKAIAVFDSNPNIVTWIKTN